MTHQHSIEEIEHALKVAARVVALYGEAYLPIFNRLHEEFDRMKAKQDKETLAIKFAKRYANLHIAQKSSHKRKTSVDFPSEK